MTLPSSKRGLSEQAWAGLALIALALCFIGPMLLLFLLSPLFDHNMQDRTGWYGAVLKSGLMFAGCLGGGIWLYRAGRRQNAPSSAADQAKSGPTS